MSVVVDVQRTDSRGQIIIVNQKFSVKFSVMYAVVEGEVLALTDVVKMR